MIRDQINIYQRNEILKVSCPSCQNYNHQINECPIINYIPNKALILENFHRENIQPRSKKCNRLKKNINARKYKYKIQFCADLIAENYPELLKNESEESKNSLSDRSSSSLVNQNFEENEILLKKEIKPNKEIDVLQPPFKAVSKTEINFIEPKETIKNIKYDIYESKNSRNIEKINLRFILFNLIKINI